MASAFVIALSSLPVMGQSTEIRIAGECERPFPAVMPLDYSRCRIIAWLHALKQAERHLPSAATARLWEMDADDSLTRLALTALLFDIEALTPDISASSHIQVFLQYPADIVQKSSKILDNPERMFLAMCFLLEMENVMTASGAAWPHSVAEANNREEELSGFSNQLAGLWDAFMALRAPEKAGYGNAFAQAATLAPESVPLLLAASRQDLEKGLAQKSLELAEMALNQCESEIYAGAPKYLKAYLRGISRYQLGLAHWHHAQSALAENDFREAASIVAQFPILHELRSRSLVALGRILQMHDDIKGMCEAFQNACSLGSCADLAEVRGRGECSDLEQ